MHKEISSFVLQVSSMFKLILFCFTTEYRSIVITVRRLIVANCNSVGDKDSRLELQSMKKRQETVLKKPRIIEKHLLPVLYCVPIDLQALVYK